MNPLTCTNPGHQGHVYFCFGDGRLACNLTRAPHHKKKRNRHNADPSTSKKRKHTKTQVGASFGEDQVGPVGRHQAGTQQVVAISYTETLNRSVWEAIACSECDSDTSDASVSECVWRLFLNKTYEIVSLLVRELGLPLPQFMGSVFLR